MNKIIKYLSVRTAFYNIKVYVVNDVLLYFGSYDAGNFFT